MRNQPIAAYSGDSRQKTHIEEAVVAWPMKPHAHGDDVSTTVNLIIIEQRATSAGRFHHILEKINILFHMTL